VSRGALAAAIALGGGAFVGLIIGVALAAAVRR
jgi:hypothetical protein